MVNSANLRGGNRVQARRAAVMKRDKAFGANHVSVKPQSKVPLQERIGAVVPPVPAMCAGPEGSDPHRSVMSRRVV